MKTIFLTSNIGAFNKAKNKIDKCDNENGFIDRLKKEKDKLKNFVFVCSNPDTHEKTNFFADIMVKSLNLDGFGIEQYFIIDHKFGGDIKKTLLSADAICLMGGNVPIQNKYLKEIKLKEVLDAYNGIIIGQSAGSINCEKKVYVQPESEEEVLDKKFKKIISGLGLVDFKLWPHMNRAKIDELFGVTTFDMCLKDSKNFPIYGITDGGYILVKKGKAIAYGETLLFKNGEVSKICSTGESVEVK